MEEKNLMTLALVAIVGVVAVVALTGLVMSNGSNGSNGITAKELENILNQQSRADANLAGNARARCDRVSVYPTQYYGSISCDVSACEDGVMQWSCHN